MQTAAIPNWMLPLIFGLVLVIIVMLYLRRRRSQDSVIKPKIVTEQRTVEKVVLVICPYCGSKNEQGITKCQNCQAAI